MKWLPCDKYKEKSWLPGVLGTNQYFIYFVNQFWRWCKYSQKSILPGVIVTGDLFRTLGIALELYEYVVAFSGAIYS